LPTSERENRARSYYVVGAHWVWSAADVLPQAAEMPTAETALPGRAQPLRTAEQHFVNGVREGPLSGRHAARPVRHGCFWGVERCSAGPASAVTAVGYVAGLTPNPTYEEVCSGRTGHNRGGAGGVRPKLVSYEDLLKVFWKATTPPRGCARATTRDPSIARI